MSIFNGSVLMANGISDSVIRLYDATTNKYKSINEVSAKDVNWCILDIAFSPDGEYFVYSTWSSCCKYLCACELLAIKKLIFSIYPFSVYISRIHDAAHNLQPLFLHPAKSSFCIFSLAFSNCGEQIIGGGSDGCLYIYDRLSDRRTLKIPVYKSGKSGSPRADNNSWPLYPHRSKPTLMT